MAADDGGVGPDRGPLLDQRPFVARGAFGVFCTGGQVVGKDHRRPAENIVLQLHPFVDRDVVLHLDAVADFNVGGDVDILPEGAVFPDDRAALDVAEEPDFGAAADRDVGVDVAAWGVRNNPAWKTLLPNQKQK